jgi:hypothetical protein
LRHRQGHAHGHEHAAAQAIEPGAEAFEQRPNAVRKQGQQVFDDELDGDKDACHDDELAQQVTAWIDELRQECAIEQQPFRVGHRGQKALAKQRSAIGVGQRCVGTELDGRRAPELDAQPDQIGAADSLEYRQCTRRGL